MRIDGFAGKLDAAVGADHAARAVAAGQIGRADGFRPAVGMLQRRRDAVGVRRESRKRGAELDAAAEPVETRAQDIQRARLQQHPHAGIGHVGRRLAPLDAMEFRGPELLRPVPGHRRIVIAAGRVHRLDHAEIVIDLERARLDALAARAGAPVRRRWAGIDDAAGNAASRQIAGQHQARGSGTGDQNVGVGQRHPLDEFPQRTDMLLPLGFRNRDF